MNWSDPPQISTESSLPYLNGPVIQEQLERSPPLLNEPIATSLDSSQTQVLWSNARYSRYVAVMMPRLPWNLLPHMQSSQNLSSPLITARRRYISNHFNAIYLNSDNTNL
jgi:hypothetical protein